MSHHEGIEPQRVWIKATRSSALNACVELARDNDSILLRDSKDPEWVQRYTQLEIEVFFDGVRRGEFDHLVRFLGPAPVGASESGNTG